MLSYFAISFVTFNSALYRTAFVYLESAYHTFMVCDCIESLTHSGELYLSSFYSVHKEILANFVNAIQRIQTVEYIEISVR